MSRKVMSKQELLDNREELIQQYKAEQKKSAKKPILTKKERKILGIGKDEGKVEVKHIRISPFKVSQVCDTVRGKDVREAKAILAYTNRGAAPVVLKALESAEANAVNNNSLNPDALYVSEIYVSPGPVLKRWRAGGKGSANRINKRTCHLNVVVRERA